MTVYDPNPAIIEASLIELQKISSWIQHRAEDPPKTILFGGWAVDAYNPYLGSVDIDIVTNSQTKHSLMYHLKSYEGYRYHDQFPLGKTVLKDFPPHGSVILDFERRELNYPFQGHPNPPFTLEILTENTITATIRGRVPMVIPNRATLVFLKLKAAWDRTYRLEHNIPVIDSEWEMGKAVKDQADILALIDPNAGGTDINLEKLGSFVKQFPFLRSIILDIPENASVRDRYGRMEASLIRTVCQNVESVI